MPYNPKSAQNLGKPKTKGGSKIFRLSPEALEILRNHKNQTQFIEDLIMATVTESNIVVISHNGTLKSACAAVWSLLGWNGTEPVSEEEIVAEGLESPYVFGRRLRDAAGDQSAPIYRWNGQNHSGCYYCIGLPEGESWWGVGDRDDRQLKIALWSPNGEICRILQG